MLNPIKDHPGFFTLDDASLEGEMKVIDGVTMPDLLPMSSQNLHALFADKFWGEAEAIVVFLSMCQKVGRLWLCIQEEAIREWVGSQMPDTSPDEIIDTLQSFVDAKICRAWYTDDWGRVFHLKPYILAVVDGDDTGVTDTHPIHDPPSLTPEEWNERRED